MGVLIKIGLALAFLAFMYGAWLGFVHWVAKPLVEEQIAADQVVVDAAKKGKADAEGERDRARTDTASCKTSLGVQTEAIAAWERISASNFKAAKDAKNRASKEATDQAPYIAQLQLDAGAKPKLMACEVELAKARPVLQKQLRQKRGIPEPTAAPVVSSPPALVK